jgi:cellulose synthase/poly-beta-1,6-N-acetylglucosamine synthase-like glycosyltransferase
MRSSRAFGSALQYVSEEAAQDRWAGCVSVIVPVHNEVVHLDELLSAVLASPVKKEIIIVDDGSTDGTREKLRVLPAMDSIRIIFDDRNCGKGPPSARLSPTLAASMC